MGRWPWLGAIGACGPLALLLLQCGGGDAASAGDDIALPTRVDGLTDGGSEAEDAPRSDSSTFAPDAPPPRCDLAKAFGAPVRLADFDAKSARATPRLTPDELAIYFTTNGADAGDDLSMATRASTTAPFAGETILAQSTPSNDNDPMVSADQLSLWFHSNRAGTADIFLATRAAAGTPFGTAAAVPGIDLPTSNQRHRALVHLGPPRHRRRLRHLRIDPHRQDVCRAGARRRAELHGAGLATAAERGRSHHALRL
jgi:hypothetical protein